MGRSSKDIDWELIERDYRIGLKTDIQLAAEHQVSRSALIRRAKKEGWTKDLSEQIKLQTKAKRSAAIVKEATEDATRTLHSSYTKDATAVEIEASVNATMIADHERFATKGVALMEALVDRINEQIAETPSLPELAAMLKEQAPEAIPGLYKVLSLPSYVASGKQAIEGGYKASDMARKARGIDDKDGKGSDTGLAAADLIASLS